MDNLEVAHVKDLKVGDILLSSEYGRNEVVRHSPGSYHIIELDDGRVIPFFPDQLVYRET